MTKLSKAQLKALTRAINDKPISRIAASELVSLDLVTSQSYYYIEGLENESCSPVYTLTARGSAALANLDN